MTEGFAIRNRLEFGKRSVGFEFTARLLSTSTEYAMLRALTTGTATMTFAYDATHTVTLAFTKIAFNKVENTSADGLVVVKVTCEVFGDDTLGVLTATTKCGVTGIGQ